MASPDTLQRAVVVPPSKSAVLLLATAGLVALIYLATLLQLTSPQGVVFGAFTQLAFAAPGVLVVHACVGQTAGWLPTLTFGPLLGMALSSLSLLAFWAAGIRDGWVLLLVAPATASLAAWPAGALHGRIRVAIAHPADAQYLLLLLLIVPIVVERAFAFVGADMVDGQVYRAYFTSDYVWRRAVISELAKGDFLPVNPFFAGDALHYYWLPHLLSAVEYRVAGHALGLDHLLLMRSVFVDALFIAFLYGVARLFVQSPWAAAAGVACSVLFTSFEGLYAIWDHWRVGAPFELLRYFNIDAVTRWLFHAMPIDGLHRVLLYQPHHAVGYCTGLLGLLLIVRRERRMDPRIVAVASGLLGLGVLISSFGGLMLTVIAAVYEAASVVRWREWRRGISHALAAAIPLSLAAAIVLLLQYVDRGGQVIQVGLNPVATHEFFRATVLSFGPALLLGGMGAWAAWRTGRGDIAVFAAFTATCVFFYFFVDIRDHQNVYVGWRVGHLIFIAAGTLIALAFETISGWSRFQRTLAWAAVTIVLLASAPTVAIDLYNTQDVANRESGPGFQWTLVLSHDELDAFEWIMANTPDSAIFQVDPIVRDSDTWAYLPAFAERRMGVGLPISMVPLDKYRHGSIEIQQIFRSGDSARSYAIATEHHVRYLLIGPPERRAYPGVEQRLDTAPTLLPLLFRNGAVSIYAVVPKSVVP